jgi:hypothetical protein
MPDRLPTPFGPPSCEANALLGEVHDLMPVILDECAAED